MAHSSGALPVIETPSIFWMMTPAVKPACAAGEFGRTCVMRIAPVCLSISSATPMPTTVISRESSELGSARFIVSGTVVFPHPQRASHFRVVAVDFAPKHFAYKAEFQFNRWPVVGDQNWRANFSRPAPGFCSFIAIQLFTSAMMPSASARNVPSGCSAILKYNSHEFVPALSMPAQKPCKSEPVRGA